ncbi:MAG: DNA alkylation repair protein [Oscillospiraceae bacterium]|jgi:3-methyladenine DNA glycosylase AlkD|nr:DNA alkylation repair protein [Oscillospiraceae bacterium]
MNFNKKWSKRHYDEFIEYLKSFEDLKYKNFNSRIMNDKTCEFIGVRTPILRKIAKEIAKNDYKDFLKFCEYKFFEEKTIHAFIINYAKTNYNELIKMIKNFIPHISNWALTDTVSKKYPQIIENFNSAFEEFEKFTKSENPWEIRLGLIFLMKNYITFEYIEKILENCKITKSEHYYVKMAVAWLVTECFCKFPKITEDFLKSKVLEKWTQNKAIQKIKESFRVNETTKKRLEMLKLA